MSSSGLVLLLGAGFSAPFGVPPMKPLFDGFVAFARTKYPQLRETLEIVLQKCSKDADVEELIAELNSAASADRGLPAHLSEDERLSKWQNDAQYLRWHLTSYIIESCENFNKASAVELCGQFFRKVADAENMPDIDIFTTNYDRVVEYICETQDITVADGFQRQTGVLVNEWSEAFDANVKLLKLHGSVTWYRYSDVSNGIALRLDRGYPLPDPTFRLAMGDKLLEPLMVLPTLEKETSEEPYGYLYQRFSHVLANAQVVVIVGNSLRDSHLVNALRYFQSSLIFLVIDRDPSPVLEHLKAERVVSVAADVGQLFSTHGSQLVEALTSALHDNDCHSAVNTISTFAKRYRETTTIVPELNPTQQSALIALSSGNDFTVLDALQSLRNVSNRAVLDRTVERLDSTSALVRKAAAGNLGIVSAVDSAGKLRHLVDHDPDASVRMEAKLALDQLE